MKRVYRVNILLVAPPGVPANEIAGELRLFYLHMGSILRKTVSRIAFQQVTACMEAHTLVPDDTVIDLLLLELSSLQIINNRIQQKLPFVGPSKAKILPKVRYKIYQGVLYDGFPATITQFNAFKKLIADGQLPGIFDINLVIRMNIDKADSLRKLEASRKHRIQALKLRYQKFMHPSCKSSRIVRSLYLQKIETLKKQLDDTNSPEALERRYERFKNTSLKLSRSLQRQKVCPVIDVNGNGTIDEIMKRIHREVQRIFRK